MRSSGGRNGLLPVALIVFALVTVPVAVAASGVAIGEDRPTELAAKSGQVKKLKKQLRKLKQRVKNIERTPGPEGPAGPQGPQGPAGLSTGPAGGDLTGSYPDPTIATGAVNADEIGQDAVGASEIIVNGVAASEIAADAVGNAEIATAAVRADQFGAVTKRVTPVEDISDTVAGNGTGGTVSLTVSCLPGEQMLSAGGEFPDESTVGKYLMLSEVEPDVSGATHTAGVGALNDSGADRNFRAWALCLTP